MKSTHNATRHLYLQRILLYYFDNVIFGEKESKFDFTEVIEERTIICYSNSLRNSRKEISLLGN